VLNDQSTWPWPVGIGAVNQRAGPFWPHLISFNEDRYRFDLVPDKMNDPIFRRNLARIEEYGWLFELQLFSGQMGNAVALAAAFPGIPFVKMSGQGTFSHRIDAEFITRDVPDSVALFGSGRCALGSNFPVEKIRSDFTRLRSAYAETLAGYPEEDRANMLRNRAARFYRL